MKKLSLLLLLIITYFGVNAQEKYSRVKIYATNQELNEIANLGIEVDHGKRKFDTWLSTDLSESQIQILENNSYLYDIEIDDVTAFYVERNLNTPIKGDDRADCGSNSPAETSFNPSTPSNFQLGTMAGFYTYQEFLDELDAMVSAYPNLITAKAPISSFTTHEGRSIYWLRISDNPNVDENEEEVFYSAIHHAREPASLSQLIFYMWYLLENYGTNEEVTYLLDHTEMYFVPMINPDGYVENVVNSPGGGGMHRKNKRNVGTTNKGVDLNRNYSYHWNESGTSPNPNNDTYAGTNAFSEPETQAIKWFCENHSFKFAHNAHSYGNLLLFPIGWAYGPIAADHDYFTAFSNHQVLFNGFNNMKSSGLYPAAGDSDDWMYMDDLATKPKIFALTPEVGGDDDGFWPAASRIIPICKSTVWMNLILAHLPHVYGYTTDLDPSKIENMSGSFNYSIERLGLTSGPITVGITPLVGIQTVGGANVHASMNIMDVETNSISYVLDPLISFGDEIKYILNTSNGLWTRHDTIIKTFGIGTSVFSDDCSNLDNWTGDWGTTTEYYNTPTTSITDSPNANYSNNTTSEIILNDILTFENATYAYAEFYARWEIENDYDYVEFMISTDNGGSWTPLCGKYTNEGVSVQDAGNQLYDGMQTDWVLEEVDLTDYIGMYGIRFKFLLISDGGVREDGFAFDDFNIYTDGFAFDGLNTFTENDFNLFPNPANTDISIYSASANAIKSISVFNNLGQVVAKVTATSSKTNINISDYEQGVYFIKIETNNHQIITKKFTVIK